MRNTTFCNSTSTYNLILIRMHEILIYAVGYWPEQFWFPINLTTTALEYLGLHSLGSPFLSLKNSDFHSLFGFQCDIWSCGHDLYSLNWWCFGIWAVFIKFRETLLYIPNVYLWCEKRNAPQQLLKMWLCKWFLYSFVKHHAWFASCPSVSLCHGI